MLFSAIALVLGVLVAEVAPDVKLKQVPAPVSCPTSDAAAMKAFNTANDADTAGDGARAERLYLEALTRDPKYCDAMDHLGRLARRRGKLDEAMVWYRKSLAVRPDNDVAQLNLATALGLQGKNDEALREIEALLRRSPDSAEAHFQAGIRYTIAHDPKRALEHAQKAEQLYAASSPELVADAKVVEGTALLFLHDCGRARAVLEPIEAKKEQDPWLNYVLGVCALDGHREELARGVPESTPWLDKARGYLRRAKAAGKQMDPELIKFLRL